MNELVDLQNGDVLTAPWGEYVYRGAKAQGGRVALADRSNPTAYVLVAIDRLTTDYQFSGRIDVQVPVHRVPPTEEEVREVRPVVVLDVSEVHMHGHRGRSVSRLTLGALRPPSNSRGMVRDEFGAGAQAILPDIETLYWLPCPVEGEAMPLEVGGEAKVLPHVFHITSSHYGGLYCPDCYARKRGRVLPLPVCVSSDALGHDSPRRSAASPASEETLSLAPGGALGHESTSCCSASLAPSGALSSPGDGGSCERALKNARPGSDHPCSTTPPSPGPMAQPESPPSPAGPVRDAGPGLVVATPAASLTAPDVDQEILAIAARIERRLERDDPKAEVAKVANFDRMPPIAPVPAAAAPPRPPARPAWHNDPPRPNRADFERAQWWEERAAIIAEGEKCSRELADDLAYKDMLAAFRRGEIW